MTDREKMVEEIEKVLQLEQIKIANTTEEFAKLQKDGINRCNAEALYNANCRIVHDGAVVLTKEELEKMDNRKNYGDVVDILFFRIRVLKREHENRLEQIRKDTAREIYENFVKGYFRWDEEEFEDSFKEFIVKEYGVEVKE